MAKASNDTVALVRALWKLHQQGRTDVEIVNLLGRQGVHMSRYDVQRVIAAAREQAERSVAGAPAAPQDLLSFIPAVSPKYGRPLHLLPLTQALEASLHRPMRCVIHAPPRHAKSETILHAIVYWMLQKPAEVTGYAAYGASLALTQSRKARAIAGRMNIPLAVDANRLSEWRTEEDGGMLATSVGGPLTGKGVMRMVVDDPIKGRAEAESRLIRDRIWDWFSSDVMTRIEPGGSVFVCMTRWHEQDLSGRLLKEQGKHRPECEDPTCQGCGPDPENGYEEIRLPAINDAGESLWPERWPIEAMLRRKKEVGEYTWSGLYQGRPRRRGGKVFEGTFFYDRAALPTQGYSIIIGLDLNYTESTQADWSVAVAMMKHGSGDKAKFYILEVLRVQTTAPKLADELRKMRRRHHGARIVSIYYGTETGTIDLFRTDRKLPITGIKRSGDKFVRAQPCAAAWNAGRIMLPQRARPSEGGDIEEEDAEFPWMDPFVDVVTEFTGVKDLVDDDVDALTAAYEGLAGVGAAMDEEQAEALGAALAEGNSPLAPGATPVVSVLRRKEAEEGPLALGPAIGADHDVGWCSIE